MTAVSDRTLVGGGAVGAAAVVLFSKVVDVTFTEAEYGILVAGSAALFTFIGELIRRKIGNNEESPSEPVSSD